jgi:site-specific recombinase XerD
VSTDLSAPAIEQASDLAVNAARFRRHLRASGLSPKTEQTYLEAVNNLAVFLADRGMPIVMASITREHIEEWLVAMRGAGRKPATLASRFRSVQQFFRWAVGEGLIKTSPMASMRPPKIPETPPPVIRDEALVELLKKVEADKSFAGQRDTAILRVFVATGARLSEVTNLRWNPSDPALNDIDLDSGLIRVVGKGNRERTMWIGSKAVRALDRYIYGQRSKHRMSSSTWLWLGPRGRFTPSGVEQMVHSRGEAAGIHGLHPHALRHNWAHTSLAAGMQEGQVMVNAGWRSQEMLRRYAASTAAERAIEAAKKSGLADRV